MCLRNLQAKMARKEQRKKLSGYQHFPNKRKREDEIEKASSKITVFFEKSAVASTNLPGSTEDNCSGPSTAMRVDVGHQVDPDFISLPSYCNKQAEDDQTELIATEQHKKESGPGEDFNSDRVPEIVGSLPISKDPDLWPGPLSPSQVKELVEYRYDKGFNDMVAEAKELTSSLDVEPIFKSQETVASDPSPHIEKVGVRHVLPEGAHKPAMIRLLNVSMLLVAFLSLDPYRHTVVVAEVLLLMKNPPYTSSPRDVSGNKSDVDKRLAVITHQGRFLAIIQEHQDET
ncbi:hypothetical protein HUJ04_012899 [Dendroctonus ponderosae]|nr:hypothetical protein HUJ04_012899 [Dendroctonus ponderosae]